MRLHRERDERDCCTALRQATVRVRTRTAARAASAKSPTSKSLVKGIVSIRWWRTDARISLDTCRRKKKMGGLDRSVGDREIGPTSGGC